ncbi:hypothetical protein O3P69_002117 [Scylla paramamosain]|uniref:Uncharacterized protein n=1 Tax=Scylla paramamosain TaxID=85552 RepID=A0AAW0V805_SCYPA
MGGNGAVVVVIVLVRGRAGWDGAGLDEAGRGRQALQGRQHRPKNDNGLSGGGGPAPLWVSAPLLFPRPSLAMHLNNVALQRLIIGSGVAVALDDEGVALRIRQNFMLPMRRFVRFGDKGSRKGEEITRGVRDVAVRPCEDILAVESSAYKILLTGLHGPPSSVRVSGDRRHLLPLAVTCDPIPSRPLVMGVRAWARGGAWA